MPPKRSHDLAKTDKPRVHSRVLAVHPGDHDSGIEERLAQLGHHCVGNALTRLDLLDEEPARAHRQPAVQLRAVEEILPIDIQTLHSSVQPNFSPSTIEYAYPCSQRNSCRLSAKS